MTTTLPASKVNPTFTASPTRLIVHYLIQCVKQGHPDAAALLLDPKVKKDLTSDECDKVREHLLEVVRKVSVQNTAFNPDAVIKAAELYLKHFA